MDDPVAESYDDPGPTCECDCICLNVPEDDGICAVCRKSCSKMA